MLNIISKNSKILKNFRKIIFGIKSHLKPNTLIKCSEIISIFCVYKQYIRNYGEANKANNHNYCTMIVNFILCIQVKMIDPCSKVFKRTKML